MWDTATGEPISALPTQADEAETIALSPDGRSLACAGGFQRVIQLFEMGSGGGLRILEGHAQAIRKLAFRPDGARLASTDWGGTVKVWDVSTGRDLVSFRGHASAIQSLAWSADGLRLATGIGGRKDRPGEIRVWDARAGVQLSELRGDIQPITGMAFHPGGRQIITTGGALGKGGQIKVWDLATGRELRELRGHTDLVSAPVFSPDGRRLVTASNDRTIKLWDAGTYQELFTLRGHTAGLFSTMFSPDGSRIVSGSSDRTAIVWDVNPLDPGMSYRREAAGCVESLYRRRLDTAAVIRDLRTDAALPDPVRRAAVEIAGRIGDRQERLNRMIRARDETNRAKALAASIGGTRSEALVALRRSCEALRRSCNLWDDLIAGDPDRAECKKELALALVAFGELLESTGQDDKADRAFDRALQLGEDLLRGGRLDRDRMWNDVAIWILDTIGNREESRGRTKEALRAFRAETAIWDEFALQWDHINASTVPRYRSEVSQKIRTLQGEAGEAVEALMLRKKPDDVNRLICRGTALLTTAGLERELGGTVSARTRAALGEVFQRLERSSLTDPSGLYNLACLYSVLSGLSPLDKTLPAERTQREQTEAADRAMAALRRAVAAGWVNAEHLKHDPDLNPLRVRPDLQRLLLDLAFPANPFAPTQP
jgi:tetratricopeptide (TPR) repeat protein